MRLSLSIVAAVLLLSLGAASPASSSEAVGHRNAGLPLAKKVITVKNKDAEISVAYPRTGNKAIDAVLTAYAQQSVALFKTYHPDFANTDHQYELDTTYVVERNDARIFAVVFTEYSDTGGVHPNSDYRTFNFLLPDGAQVFLPEILDGPNGIDRLSRLTIAKLIKDIGTGPEAASDADSIKSGAGPSAENFRNFVWLPSKLHLYFPPYQVASYASGPQETTIPLQALKDVIRTDWRAPAPSFDCTKAATSIEHAICADAGLARLDRQVAEAYQSALHNAYEPTAQEQLRQVQRIWIATRNKACAGTAPGPCLTKYYRGRLAALTKP